MKMPAAYATGISVDASTRRCLRREPDLGVVVAFAERQEDGVVHSRRVEERGQLGLEGDERRVLHDQLVRLVPETCGRRHGGRGLGLVDESVNCRVVEATPVAAREAERAVEDVREGGATIGRAEPVGDPTGLSDVPLAGLEA